jgi:hypothetical protein
MKPVSRGDISARLRNRRKSECGAVMVTDRAIPRGESLLTPSRAYELGMNMIKLKEFDLIIDRNSLGVKRYEAT